MMALSLPDVTSCQSTGGPTVRLRKRGKQEEKEGGTMWLYVAVFVAGNITSLLLLFALILRKLQQATEKNERVTTELQMGPKIALPSTSSHLDLPMNTLSNTIQDALEGDKTKATTLEGAKEDIQKIETAIEQPFCFDPPSKVRY